MIADEGVAKAKRRIERRVTNEYQPGDGATDVPKRVIVQSAKRESVVDETRRKRAQQIQRRNGEWWW